MTFSPFTRIGIDILAHYSVRKSQQTRQFEDCCIQAGIREPVELRLDWEPTNLVILPRPYVCVQLPRAPMGRKDGFGKELLPDCKAIQKAIDAVRGKATIVQIGSGQPLHRFEGIDVDLSNKTTVCQLIDTAQEATAFIGYVSFLLPLAESFDKPCLMVWSSRGLKAKHNYVRQITPQKVIWKETSKYVFDTSSEDEIKKAANALL